ncbi:phasin family protein [Novosphingobium sp.]|uniref:phasin family protein n=1 Tax=Novosphingobium sp. TaxID=1874826 RepID=UPI0022C989C3|nr:phasin family protein [Novosphingobium sp.]MCZ8018179.1 phasin family protein [Novosphingobium sp.]MCZ8033173.1 phasin family protein [Novosphingobium sp.]MCZ8051628.1 phasin family protein [Novosphingobium sp.]MCZ8060170.1 phasin family protein [Novosphingobium sp.]MCZ8231812.1 phasin family protein [Novosphingobium sp.]
MAEATVNKIDEAKAEVLAEKAYAAAAAATEAKAAPAAAPKKAVAAKAAAVKKAVAPKAAAKPAPAKKVAAKKTATKIAPKVAKPAAKKVAKAAPLKSKDSSIMAKTQHAAEDLTAKVKDAVADLQERAKTAFEKSNETFAELNEFTKGNVEALVESGKVLAAGLQDLGKVYVEDAKTGFETMTADVKELAAVKSPTDFFKLQGEILRRNFDAAVATGSKRSEAIVKLANDAFAPVQNRVSIAIEKVKQAA